jgi:hypothetical protein
LLGQLNDLAADLPACHWIGAGREDAQMPDEFMAVFYRHERLTPLATNRFCLSDAPEVPRHGTGEAHQDRKLRGEWPISQRSLPDDG